MKNFITRENFKHRFLQLFILVAHLVLLKWILYTLYQGGVLPFKALLMHFLGISAFGALLIRFCAWIYKRQYEKELKEHAESNKLDA